MWRVIVGRIGVAGVRWKFAAVGPRFVYLHGILSIGVQSEATSDVDHDRPMSELELSLSPSLRVGEGARAAYEVKFLLEEAEAREVEARLTGVLLPDPHSDPTLGGMYDVTTIACDGTDLPVFFRDARMDYRKYRVRRYGGDERIYLECKRSRKGRVSKRREALPIDALPELMTGRGTGVGDAMGAWFVREVQGLDLAPVCIVRCLRRAMYGDVGEGPMRVTFDRSVRTARAGGWSFRAAGEQRAVLDGVVVCEFKFHDAMPTPLKAIAADLRLNPVGVSKYRASVRTLAPELGVVVDGPGTPGGGGLA